jgi:hypothetical protein
LYSHGIEDVSTIPGGSSGSLPGSTPPSDTLSNIINDTLTNPFATNITVPTNADPSYGKRTKWDNSKIQSKYNLRTEVQVTRMPTYTTNIPTQSDHAYNVFGVKPKSRELIDRYNLSYTDAEVVSNALPLITQPNNSKLPKSTSNTLSQKILPVSEQIANAINYITKPVDKAKIQEYKAQIEEKKALKRAVQGKVEITEWDNVWIYIAIISGMVLLMIGIFLVYEVLNKPPTTKSTTTPSQKDYTDSTKKTTSPSDTTRSYTQNNERQLLTQNESNTNVVTREDITDSLKDTHSIIQVYSNTYDKLDTYHRPSYYTELSDNIIKGRYSWMIFIYGIILLGFLIITWTRSLSILKKTYISNLTQISFLIANFKLKYIL